MKNGTSHLSKYLGKTLAGFNDRSYVPTVKAVYLQLTGNGATFVPKPIFKFILQFISLTGFYA